MSEASFAERVLEWFDQHGRTHLPWQQDRTAYRVWISEIMLQQTQVATVISYYEKFMTSFPTVQALADASEDEVLSHWAGLGYYSRARNLHKAAKLVCTDFNGEMPNTLDNMMLLSGIGRSTAGAILSLSQNQKHPILDGNVKRVLSRYHAVAGWPGKSAVLKQLWALAEQHVPDSRNADYTQVMMDLGATLCTRSKPNCEQCPLQADCQAYADGNPADYPGKKPKKTIPTKQAVLLLVMQDNGSTLIEKRPPTGIWGGLWSLPQFDDEEKARAWVKQHFTDTPVEFDHYAEITHTFSHFHLHAATYKVQLNTDYKTGIMEADAYLWYNNPHEFTGGFPAPIKKLLASERTLL